jgi:lysophospholipase L1-like esterase
MGGGKVNRGVFFAVALCSLFGPALTASRATSPSAEVCLAAAVRLDLGSPLPRLKARFDAGEPVRIVAIGSSSTRGIGASTPAATYPEVMQRELLRLRPQAEITIVNRGNNGETIPDQLSRMGRDVLALKPDLVIWQLGANDVLARAAPSQEGLAQGGLAQEGLAERVAAGIRAIKATGADVILMDLQNAPMVTRTPSHRPMLQMIETAARTSGAGYFRRFALLEGAVASGVALSDLTSRDELHSTDIGYDCVGRAIARSITLAAR